MQYSERLFSILPTSIYPRNVRWFVSPYLASVLFVAVEEARPPIGTLMWQLHMSLWRTAVR